MGKHSLFSEHAYQIKWKEHGSKYFTPRPPTPRPWWRGSNVKKSTFFQNMVRLHIKLNGITCAATWLQIFYPKIPLHTHPTLGDRVKIQLFQNMVMLHIKLNGTTQAATCKRILCPYTHPRPLEWGQRSKLFFSESSHVAYQVRRERSIEHHASIYSVLTHPRPLGGVKGKNIFF